VALSTLVVGVIVLVAVAKRGRSLWLKVLLRIASSLGIASSLERLDLQQVLSPMPSVLLETLTADNT
jgi:hypothetical protein